MKPLSIGRDEGTHEWVRAQTMSEYALILSLVAVVGLAAWALLGTNITALINQIAGCI